MERANIKKMLDYISKVVESHLEPHLFEMNTKLSPFYVFSPRTNTVITMWHIGNGEYEVNLTIVEN